MVAGHIRALASSVAHWIATAIPTSQSGRAVAVLSGSVVLTQGLSLVVMPIATRLYTKDDFGCASVFGSFLAVLAIAGTLRFDLAITQARDDTEAKQVLWLSLVTTLATSCSAVALLLFAGSWLSRITGAGGLKAWWWMLGVGMAVTGIFSSLSYLALRSKLYGLIARSRVKQSLGGAVAILGVGSLTSGPLGLLVGGVASQGTGILNLFRGLRVAALANYGPPTGAELRGCLGRLRNYPTHFCTAALLNSLSLVVVAPLLSRLYGTDVTGALGVAQRCVLLPMTVVGSAVAQVFLAEASASHRANPAALRSLMKKTVVRMIPWAGCLLLAAPIMPVLFRFVFGASWRDAGEFASLLAISAAAQILVSPISNVAYILSRERIQLTLDTVRTTLVIGAILLSFGVGLGPYGSVASFAGAMVLAYVIESLVYFHIARAPGG
jgi:O-antigen/teichoic acid export membrane protein